MKRKEQGAALVIGLLLLTVATIVGVAGLSGSNMQERISANQKQQTEAFMAAESGMASASDYLFSIASFDCEDVDDVNDFLAVHNAIAVGNNTQYTVTVESCNTPSNTVTLRSRGEIIGQAGQRNIVALFEVPGPGSGGLLPSGAVVACDGVDVQGSSQITSFDSQDAGYSGNDADVRTINSNSDVTLHGSADIRGDVEATGGVSIPGSSQVHGNVYANNDVIVSGGGSRIFGDLRTQGNISIPGSAQVGLPGGGSSIWGNHITMSSSTIHGNVSSTGNLVMTSNSHIHNGAVDINGSVNIFASGGGRIHDGMLTYGGSILGMAGWQNLSDYAMGGANNSNPGVLTPPAMPPPATPAPDCEPLNAAQLVTDAQPSPPDVIAGNFSLPGGPVSSFQLADYISDTGPDHLGLQVNGNFTVASNHHLHFPAGKNADLRVNGNFSLGGSGRIHIPENVDAVLWVGGNIDIGGSGRLIIGTGSTVKIYVQGTMDAGGSGLIVNQGSAIVNRGGELLRSLSIISSHASNSDGIDISGSSNYYASIYAPLTNVELNGSGQLRGSVWAQRVDLTGNADVLYDVSLAGAPIGGSSPDTVRLTSWREVVN